MLKNLFHNLVNPLGLIHMVGMFGVFAAVFAESGLFFGFFLPGDSLLFTAGLLSSQGFFSMYWLIIGCIIAAIAGDTVGYFFGKKIGPKIFSWQESLFFKKEHLKRAQKFYDKHGNKTIVLARFIPIIRTFAPIVAGLAGMRYSVFALYNAIGGISWCVALIVLGHFLGNSIPNIDHYILPIVLFIIVVSTLPVIFHIFKKNK
jgi:membrane-associated protein